MNISRINALCIQNNEARIIDICPHCEVSSFHVKGKATVTIDNTQSPDLTITDLYDSNGNLVLSSLLLSDSVLCALMQVVQKSNDKGRYTISTYTYVREEYTHQEDVDTKESSVIAMLQDAFNKPRK